MLDHLGMIDNETLPVSRREAVRQRRRQRATRITIPENVSPHVRLVFTEMGRQRRTYDEVEELSGVLRTTLKAWRHKNKPGIESLAAVLAVLGWDFVPIPRAKTLPAALVADLEAVATKHSLDASATIETLIAHVTRWRDHAPEAPSTAPDIEDLACGIGGADVAMA